MPLIAGMIDEALQDTRERIKTLTEGSARPHVMDDAAVDRLDVVHAEQTQFVDLCAEQMGGWRSERPSANQARDLDRMEEQNSCGKQPWPSLRCPVSYAKGPSSACDIELGLEALRRRRRRAQRSPLDPGSLRSSELFPPHANFGGIADRGEEAVVAGMHDPKYAASSSTLDLRMIRPARPTDVNQTQSQVWNGEAGRAWVEGGALLDRMYQPVVDAIVAACPPTRNARVLDVGCGTGALTIAYARHLDSGPPCVGVDLSALMIEAARARSEHEKTNASFIQADAQVHPFEEASFDFFVSRFGVMFFDDAVRAFSNLRRAAKPNAKACFAVWRGPADNVFMSEAERVAAPFLPDSPAPEPGAPGRFSLSDRDRIEFILSNSGWSEIDILRADIPCSFPLSELEYMFTSFGPIGGAFRQLDKESQAQLIKTVRPVFSENIIGEEVHFVAGCWIILAHASQGI